MPPDPKLQKLVAELAGLHRDDVETILEQFSLGERQTVETLLKEFTQFGFGGATPSVIDFDRSRFSSWLVERIAGDEGRLTETARGALRDCAIALCPATASNGSRSPKRRSSLGWVTQWVPRRASP